jgi:hypothetical protein
MRNIDKYKKDLDNLVDLGNRLLAAMYLEVSPKEAKDSLKSQLKDEYDEYLKKVPDFRHKYQAWYSESKTLIKKLLPDRFDDFVRAYEKPKTRKSVEYGNYVIEDFLISLKVTRVGEVIVGPKAALQVYLQQLRILESVKERFKSSLFDIEQLVQADLFDSEIESAKQLSKNKFYRAAGVICGVILEKHLIQICQNHSIKINRSKPTINDLNELLKGEAVIEISSWRYIQHLGDLRNLCGHNGEREPNKEDIEDLINGVDKIIKTLF